MSYIPPRQPDYESPRSGAGFWWPELIYEDVDGDVEPMTVVGGLLCHHVLGEWVPFSNFVQEVYSCWLAGQLLK